MSRRFIFGVGPLLLVVASFTLDWIRAIYLKKFAESNAISSFSATPFSGFSKQARSIRKAVPSGPLQIRLKALEITSLLLTLGFVALLILSIKQK